MLLTSFHNSATSLSRYICVLNRILLHGQMFIQTLSKKSNLRLSNFLVLAFQILLPSRLSKLMLLISVIVGSLSKGLIIKKKLSLSLLSIGIILNKTIPQSRKKFWQLCCAFPNFNLIYSIKSFYFVLIVSQQKMF